MNFSYQRCENLGTVIMDNYECVPIVARKLKKLTCSNIL